MDAAPNLDEPFMPDGLDDEPDNYDDDEPTNEEAEAINQEPGEDINLGSPTVDPEEGQDDPAERKYNPKYEAEDEFFFEEAGDNTPFDMSLIRQDHNLTLRLKQRIDNIQPAMITAIIDRLHMIEATGLGVV